MRRWLERAQRAGPVGSGDDNAMDLDQARSVAPYFRAAKRLADEIVRRSQAVVKQWPKIAASLKIRDREQARMAPAFRLVG